MATGPVIPIIRHIRRIALLHDNGDISDGWLLDAFLKTKDETAFEALVKRHGPMVLGVCSRLLRNTHDAEDAFQATFIVLLRKAHAIRNRDLLGNWLYGVACRTAMKVRANAARRKAKERQVTDMRPRFRSAEQTSEELLALLDVELHRLPDKLRAPLVLCDLEGMARKEAARKLGWPIGSLNWRLARSRTILAKKLKQHGVTLGTGTLAACLARRATAVSVPAPLLGLTVKTGVLMSISKNAAAGVVSAKVASLAEGVVRTMFLTKLKIAAGLVLLVGVLGTCVGQRSSQTFAAEAHYQAFSPVTNDPAKEEPSTPAPRDNFVVRAATPEIARAIQMAAERHRKEQAQEWLGKELPGWSERCSIEVKVTPGGLAGATTFCFEAGAVAHQAMVLEGPLDRVLASALPHEMTHVVLAHFFGAQLPRWADEGAAVLSSDDMARKQLEEALQVILLDPERYIPLRSLMNRMDFPTDAAALYAEGYSLTRFLVEAKDRRAFLAFMSTGMRDGWDQAVRRHYGYPTVEALEAAWLKKMKHEPASEAKEPNGRRVKRPLPPGDLERKLAHAFDEEAATAPIKIEWPSQQMILAAKEAQMLSDGHMRFLCCWYASFDRGKVTTWHCAEATFTFDKPLSTFLDVTNRTIVSIDASGDVHIAFRKLDQ